MGFLKYGDRGDLATAARYLQSTPGQGQDFVQLAKELHALRSRYKGDIALLSDDPNGTVEIGLPPGEVRAGLLKVGATTEDATLCHRRGGVGSKAATFWRDLGGI
jgi:hypothetical protein